MAVSNLTKDQVQNRCNCPAIRLQTKGAFTYIYAHTTVIKISDSAFLPASLHS